MTQCLTSPDPPPKSRHVREKARLGRPMGFASWSNEEKRKLTLVNDILSISTVSLSLSNTA